MKKQRPRKLTSADIIRMIRKPLPKKTGGAHMPKTAYRRKREKDAFRKEVRELL